MSREPKMHIQGAELGHHPEASALNSSFRSDTPILKLRLDIRWDPEDTIVELAALEHRLVQLCPSLRQHRCRGREEYHILRNVDAPGPSGETQQAFVEAPLALAHLFEHVLIDAIAYITDAPTVSGATAALLGSRTRFDLFVESPDDVVAFLTVKLAAGWIGDLVVGASPDGERRTTLELSRHLYRSQPDPVETGQAARSLGRPSCEVQHGFEWLEHRGLTRRVGYTMNFSGLCYYGLPATAWPSTSAAQEPAARPAILGTNSPG